MADPRLQRGGLFSGDLARSPEGALIARIKLPDTVLGPALKHLLIDTSEDGHDGPVDSRSLSVREFGTIYEGLLESSLSLTDQDLTVDTKGAWVPARKGDEVYAPAGAVYFHTASGERKATGSVVAGAGVAIFADGAIDSVFENGRDCCRGR